MIIVYTPAGGEPEHYDASTLRVSEVSIVQRTIDQRWAEIKEGLGTEDLDAMRGIAWVIKKRSQPALRWAEFDPGITEMVTRMDNAEVRAYVDNAAQILATDPAVSPKAVAAAMEELPAACIDPEFAEALIADLVAGPKEPTVEEPPALEQTPPQVPQPSPSPTSSVPETSTSDSSPTSSTSPLQPSMT
ncbi:hypothetical protein SALBM135S_05881 [Streptomyces alboniger]